MLCGLLFLQVLNGRLNANEYSLLIHNFSLKKYSPYDEMYYNCEKHPREQHYVCEMIDIDAKAHPIKEDF